MKRMKFVKVSDLKYSSELLGLDSGPKTGKYLSVTATGFKAPEGVSMTERGQSEMRKQLGQAIDEAIKPHFNALRQEVGGVKDEISGVKTELHKLQTEMITRLDAIVAALNHNKL